MTARRLFAAVSVALSLAIAAPASARADSDGVRLKDLGRLDGWNDSALVGYGLVTGLSGSGDTPRNVIAQQALRNVLSRLGLNVAAEDVQSRNVAAVTVTATLPATTRAGDKMDVAIASIGDARSLAGGVLLMTPLRGPDDKVYALAQGPVAVGGHRFDSLLNQAQRNYPAAGVISGGATAQVAVGSDVRREGGRLVFVLREPDFTTAARVADAVNEALGSGAAEIVDANAVAIRVAGSADDVYRTIGRIEGLTVTPDGAARVVVNERTGTVVAGGGVRISSAVVAQGDLKVSVASVQSASQPPFAVDTGRGVQSLLVTNNQIDIARGDDIAVTFPNSTVADLVAALTALKVDTRGKIAILQSLRAAGALHADLIVQ